MYETKDGSKKQRQLLKNSVGISDASAPARLTLSQIARLKGRIRFIDDGSTLTMKLPILRRERFSLHLGAGVILFSSISSLILPTSSFLWLIFLIPIMGITLALSILFIYVTFDERITKLNKISVSTQLRILGLNVHSQNMKSCHVRNIELRKSGEINKIEYFQLIAHSHEKKAMILADAIHGRELAEALKPYVQERISGMPLPFLSYEGGQDELIL